MKAALELLYLPVDEVQPMLEADAAEYGPAIHLNGLVFLYIFNAHAMHFAAARAWHLDIFGLTGHNIKIIAPII